MERACCFVHVAAILSQNSDRRARFEACDNDSLGHEAVGWITLGEVKMPHYGMTNDLDTVARIEREG